MPFEDTIILEFNQNQKNYYLEFIIEKNGGCENDPENSSTTKVREHVQSAFSMSTISSFRSRRKKYSI